MECVAVECPKCNRPILSCQAGVYGSVRCVMCKGYVHFGTPQEGIFSFYTDGKVLDKSGIGEISVDHRHKEAG